MKAAEVKKKVKQKKNFKKSQINSIKKPDLDNNQIKSFKNVLSNLLTDPNSNFIQFPILTYYLKTIQ